MGAKSGIKWNGVTQAQTQNTIETIGSDVQIILRDPRTEQEWVTSSTDYINALVSLGVISSSGGWGLTGNAETSYPTNFIGTTDAQPFAAKSNNILMLALSGATNQFSLKTSEDPDNYAEYFGDGSNIHIRTFAAGVETGDIYLNEDVNIYNNKLVVKADGNVGIGTAAPTSLLTVDDGDIEVIGNTNGIILKSPDATRYRVTVANGGTLTVTAI